MVYTATVLDVIDLVGIIYEFLNLKDQLNFLSMTKYVYVNSKCFRYLKLNRHYSRLFYNKDVALLKIKPRTTSLPDGTTGHKNMRRKFRKKVHQKISSNYLNKNNGIMINHSF